MSPARPIALCYRCEDRDAGDIYYRIVPSGLLAIHGLLRREGFDSRLFNFSGRSWADVRAALAGLKPMLVGISHFTYNHAASVRLYQTVRRACPGAVVAGGGMQPTFLDELLLARIPELDLAVRGEGEGPALELARRLAVGSRDFAAVPGLSLRAGGGVIRTPDAEPWPDLDALHGPERWDALDGVRADEQPGFLVTSRGCPGRCTFCCTPAFWGRQLRRRSAAAVVDEMEMLRRRFGVTYFGIRDDSFTADRAHVLEFCRRLRERGLGVLWNCQSRINLMDDELAVAMRQAGCDQIQFGVESASPRILERLDKAVRPEHIPRTLRACRTAGVRTSAYFITGVPGQTAADLELDQALFREHGLQDGIVSPLCYYPGTALFAEAAAAGAASPEIFLQGKPEALQVRRDAAAVRDYRELVAFIEMARPRNAFTETELRNHLGRTGECLSALLEWGRFAEGHGRRRQALMAYQDIVRRWPGSAWGYRAVADMLNGLGRKWDFRDWEAAATLAARGERVQPPPSPRVWDHGLGNHRRK